MYEYSGLQVGGRCASGCLLALVKPKDMVKVVETIILLSCDRFSLFADAVTALQKSRHRTIWKILINQCTLAP